MYASDPAAVVSAAPPPVRQSPTEDWESDALLRSVGNTPLVPLRRLSAAAGGGFELLAKAEFLNPTGSVKDRAAFGIVRSALADGRLDVSKTLLDASSGNTAVAFAFLGARLGFRVELVVPRNVHPERLQRLRALGAFVDFTDPADGTDGAQQEARRRAERYPDRYFYADQYNNRANPEAHFRTTGPEIWEATHGRVSHFVAGVGTGGTISGVGRYLRSRNPSVRVIGVEPDGPLHGLEGLKHLPTALRPSTYDVGVVDETVRIATETAELMRARLAREEGLTVGASAAAAVAVALEVGRRNITSCVVTVLPDAGHGRPGDAP